VQTKKVKQVFKRK